MLDLNILEIHLDLINMSKFLLINKKILRFNKKISVSGDKSLSIRWVLLASQAIGKSKGYNLLMSEDVLAALEAVKKLGIKVKVQKNHCEIHGNDTYFHHHFYLKNANLTVLHHWNILF